MKLRVTGSRPGRMPCDLHYVNDGLSEGESYEWKSNIFRKRFCYHSSTSDSQFCQKSLRSLVVSVRSKPS
jgi:hypothetical protein